MRKHFSITQHIVNRAAFIRLVGILVGFRPYCGGIIYFPKIRSKGSGTDTAGKCIQTVNITDSLFQCQHNGGLGEVGGGDCK